MEGLIKSATKSKYLSIKSVLFFSCEVEWEGEGNDFIKPALKGKTAICNESPTNSRRFAPQSAH